MIIGNNNARGINYKAGAKRLGAPGLASIFKLFEKSSKGEPSGKRGSDGPSPPLITIEVEIFTTAGDSRSAKSAKLSGRPRPGLGLLAM